MDFITPGLLNDVSLTVVLATIAIAVITDKLVWHTRLAKAEARAERWESLALEALSVGGHAGVKAAETTVAVVSAIPDPANEQGTDQAGG